MANCNAAVSAWPRRVVPHKILIIEDDAETADEIATLLSASGFEPTLSFNGEAGLHLALSEPYDAITLDRMLPGCNGLEVVKALRDAGRQTPVLMVSALGDVDDRVSGLRAGGDDYMIKPFAPIELVARLEVCCDGAPTAPSLSSR